MQGKYQQMIIEPDQDPIVGKDETSGNNGASGKAGIGPARTDVDTLLRAILRDVLALDQVQVDGFDNDTGLFGHLPELDSMAVATLFTEMEDRLDIIIEDDDVDGEMLETYGGLLTFAETRALES